jgi:type IV pilus assembly protein PilO
MIKLLNGSMARFRKDPRAVVRLALGLLLLANLVVAVIVLKPWAGSAGDLERQLASLRKQVRDRQATLDRMRTLVSKIESARAEGDRFLDSCFMNRRTASSTIVSELQTTAQQAGIKQKQVDYVFEPIEGSDTLSMMTVTANYEGSFADLMQFINLLDRSPRFLILETLTAAPQPSGLLLNVGMKLNSFVREGAP